MIQSRAQLTSERFRYATYLTGMEKSPRDLLEKRP
jgi:hypothetical protein